MIWTLGILVVFYIAFRFFTDLNKDNDDLNGKTLESKFATLIHQINHAAFNGLGTVTPLNKRNLYQDGKNQVIRFTYGTGHLTIIWKYKYFQKEVTHEKTFREVRNLSIFEQQKIAEVMINEMELIIQRHSLDVLNVR